MRTVNTSLVENYADKLREVLPLARRAYGTQSADSVERRYSERANAILLEYVDENDGNITHLAEALDGVISLPGLRRRVRTARGSGRLGELRASGKPLRGDRDPERIQTAAKRISDAKSVSSAAYAEAVRDAYRDGLSLAEVGRACVPELSYYSLRSAASNNT